MTTDNMSKSKIKNHKKKYLSIRFDLDSVRCLEEGLPNLIRLGGKYDIPNTFFVNIGYSFNFHINFAGVLKKLLSRQKNGKNKRSKFLPLTRKHSLGSLLKTVFLNPKLGSKYKDILIEAQANGHELGLHGGMDHVIWQKTLNTLSHEELYNLFEPAYQEFKNLFGQPAGFSSPGFVFNEEVLKLIDRFEFSYASDMEGDYPFKCDFDKKSYRHYQVPVNVIGPQKVPLIEYYLARGLKTQEIIGKVAQKIRNLDFAVLYGHPFVEGIHYEILEGIILLLRNEYNFVSMSELLHFWKQSDNASAGSK